MTSIKLREPCPKKHSASSSRYMSCPRKIDGDFKCTGYLQGNTVVVKDAEQISTLYYVGCFGNRSIPRKTFLPNNTNSVNFTACEDNLTEEKNKTILMKEDNTHSTFDVLNLSLMEAFYLVFVVKCLTVNDQTKANYDVNELWIRCCNQNPNFIPLYIAYNHFRHKGWVVKTGLKYGTDFLLYKDGPMFYHASYSVLVQAVNNDLTSDPLYSSRQFNWKDLVGLHRITEHVSKVKSS